MSARGGFGSDPAEAGRRAVASVGRVLAGVALGLRASALVASIPPALAVSAGALGFVPATSRQGWLVTGRPEMSIVPRVHPEEKPA